MILHVKAGRWRNILNIIEAANSIKKDVDVSVHLVNDWIYLKGNGVELGYQLGTESSRGQIWVEDESGYDPKNPPMMGGKIDTAAVRLLKIPGITYRLSLEDMQRETNRGWNGWFKFAIGDNVIRFMNGYHEQEGDYN